MMKVLGLLFVIGRILLKQEL